MRHTGISLAAAQERRAAILAAYSANASAEAIAAQHGVSARYVLMLAREAGLSRPRGRPQGSMGPKWQRVPVDGWRAPVAITARRSGYAFHAIEGAAL